LDKDKQELVRAPWRTLSNNAVVEDTRWIIEFADRDTAARRDAMGAIGYCMGGRYVCCVAGHYPERFHACASMHGTALVTEKGDSPHLRATRIRGELYCGFAENDKGAPPAMVEAFAQAMATSEATYRYRVHKSVEHGYALPDRDIANKEAMNRDWEVIFPMFRRRLQ
jgi:carboxymethylenebutenolidase